MLKSKKLVSEEKKSLSELPENSHHCLDCTNRTQRFNFDIEKIEGECLGCIDQSNFNQREVRAYESR